MVSRRVRTAVAQDLAVGGPVIVGLAVFNASVHLPAVETGLSNAVIGFGISFVMVYLSLRGFVEHWVRASGVG